MAATQKNKRKLSKSNSRHKTTKTAKTAKTTRSVSGRILPPIDITNTNQLDELDKRISIGPITLVLVYADWCGHCTRYKPNMEQLENDSNRSVQTVRIRDDVFPKSSINNTPIEGYPSILLIKQNNEAVEFKNEKGKVTNVVPEYNDMSSMTALVRNAGTPEGMKLVATNSKNTPIIDFTNIKSNTPVPLTPSPSRNNTMASPLAPSRNNTMASPLTPSPSRNNMIVSPLSPSRNNSKNNSRNNVVDSLLPSSPVNTASLNPSEQTAYSRNNVSTERNENSAVIYTPLTASTVAEPPNILLDRKSANMLKAQEQVVDQTTTPLTQEGQKGGNLMTVLSKVAYEYGPAAALLYMANTTANRKGKTNKKSKRA